MFFEKDTIAAISTPTGTGGIGIIRISGENAVGTTDGIFRAKRTIKEMESHTIQYGKIVDPESGDVADEVMVTKMCAPKTYTKEDVVEINCHGSMFIQREILRLLYSNGARPAEPGEFTKRAFLNGRIDLTQAEAVMDVINSETEKSADAALMQLSGKVSGYLNEITDRLLTIMARIEVTADYPEHDDEYSVSVIANDEIEDIIEKLKSAAQSYSKGRLLKTGIRTVIAGRPNVGKSTLLNELSGYERAIVTNVPGTTRDIVEERVNIDGICLCLSDTAGIRETEDIVEQIGVNKARESLKNCDLCIYVIAADDIDGIYDEAEGDIKDNKAVIVINKTDTKSPEEIQTIKNKIDEIYKDRINQGEIKTCTAHFSTGEGTDNVKNAIRDLFETGNINANSQIMITAERHFDLIGRSINSLKNALSAMNCGMPLDMISIDIRNAAEYIGEITGASISEDLTDRIFSTFCLGK